MLAQNVNLYACNYLSLVPKFSVQLLKLFLKFYKFYDEIVAFMNSIYFTLWLYLENP